MISKIRFKNFKLFKERQELEIKPITILIGKNNTGKTAVLKLPTMIAGSFNGNLELENQSVRIGYSYEDLFYNRDLNTEPLIFEIDTNDEKSIEITFTGEINGNIKLKKYLLKGLSSSVKPNRTNVKPNSTKAWMQKHIPKQNFDYIETYRKKPDYTIRNSYKDHKIIGLNGENSFDIFYNSYKTDKILYNALSDWYRANFEGWKVQVDEVSGTSIQYEITLKNEQIKPVNILNTGSGILQSFPLIVRSFMKETENTLIIIEEPESHLHPAAHGNLAQRFVESYLDDPNKRYLIETHSENFILRLQNLIADPDIPFNTKDLIIYYVDYDEKEKASQLQPLKIEEDGEIEDWPDNVFNENVDEVFKLRRNQKKRKDYASKN
jgi:predicted ATPase